MPSMGAIEIAGALQGVLGDVENRDFTLDLPQEEAMVTIGSRIIGGAKAGYIEAYTGFGKSLQIALLAEAAVRAGRRVHILASTRDIADQLIGANGKTGIGRFTRLLESDTPLVEQNYDGRHAGTKTPVVVSTYSGMLQEARAITNEGAGRLGKFDLILADECHHSLGTSTVRALYSYMPDAIRIGFSATPDFAADRKSAEIFDKSWFEFSLKAAIESGRTAPIRALLIATDAQLELNTGQVEFTERELAPLIDDPTRNGIALKLAHDFVADGRQVLIAGVAGGNNRHAIILANLLSSMHTNGRRIVAADIGSHLSRYDHRERLEAYRNGQIDILCTTRALEEGVDLPRASVYINLQPTTSERRTKQMLGRILRINPDGKESIFVDFVDQQLGKNKPQYTALHALEIVEVDSERVLGWGWPSETRKTQQAKSLEGVLSPELLTRLLRVQGRILEDVLTTNTGVKVDPIAQHWERMLRSEGMPSNLPTNTAFTPSLDQKYQHQADILGKINGAPPTHNEIVARLAARVNKSELSILRHFGQQVLIDGGMLNELPELREPVDDAVGRIVLGGIIKTLLNTLSEREAGILMHRFGIGDNRELTLEETGRLYGIGKERARAIQSDLLRRIREMRADLHDFVADLPTADSAQSAPPYQKATRGTSIFQDTPKVPIHDDEDNRPYIVRLEEKSRHQAQAWLDEKVKAIIYLRQSQLRREIADTGNQMQLASATLRRIKDRPMPPQSRGARHASIMVAEIKMHSLERYRAELLQHMSQIS